MVETINSSPAGKLNEITRQVLGDIITTIFTKQKTGNKPKFSVTENWLNE